MLQVVHVCSATCNHHRIHWDEEMEEMSRREGGFERCIESVFQLLGEYVNTYMTNNINIKSFGKMI
jgi:hypothetical protein